MQETLDQGCKKIDDIVMSQTDLGLTDRSMVWNTDLMEAMELENLLINSSITMHSAEQRKESRGAHARDKDWIRHTLGYFDHTTQAKVTPFLAFHSPYCTK
jgi:succinate dehydrogenase (ubiquinone) flavoprotein subunit